MQAHRFDCFKDSQTHSQRQRQRFRDQGVEGSILLQIGTSIGEWVANVELIALHFDLMLWWHNGMKAAYEFVYLLACIHLPLPDSNGNQERTFSAAGWYDGKLNQNQNAATFEMKTLLYQNRGFLKQARPHITEELKRMAAQATRNLLKKRHQAVVVSEPHEEDEDAWVEQVMDDREECASELSVSSSSTSS